LFNTIIEKKIMKKKIFTLIAAVVITASTFAQAPEKMSYQAVIRNAANALVANQMVGMQISILQTTATGTAVYVETQTPTTNANGLVSLEIGTGTPVTGTFAAIDWSVGPYFIKTETDPIGGSSYTISGTSQLLSVPFALHTKQAANGLPSGGTEGQVLAINSLGVVVWTNPVLGSIFYRDIDSDGFGSIHYPIVAITMPAGHVNNNTDCDDGDDSINPTTVWYLDADGDNYAVSTITQCDNPGVGYTTIVLRLGDCDDGDGTINPGVTEILANGKDDDCDGQVDEVAIGDLVEGGIVFWVDPSDNTKGKVCALADAPTKLNWNNAYSYCNGYTNPDTGTGTYNNWYLPSKDELQLMYANLQRFECSTNTPGGIDDDLCATPRGSLSLNYYWSSTEYDNYVAWRQDFGNGNQTSTNEIRTYNVRAVRAF
jgi:hypothetical protein